MLQSNFGENCMSEMIQVKMFEVTSCYSNYDNSEFIKGISDWQEISKEDFEYIKSRLPGNVVMVRKIDQAEFNFVIGNYIANMKKDDLKSAKLMADHLAKQKILDQKKLDKKLKAAQKLLIEHSQLDVVQI